MQPIAVIVPNDRHEWLKVRQQGIGGSDASIIVGMNKYKTPVELWEQKRAPDVHEEESAALFAGRYLEPAIRQMYTAKTGVNVIYPVPMFRHPVHTFMQVNLDGVIDEDTLFEAKTAQYSDDWGEEFSDQIPDAYWLQCQHAMYVTGTSSTVVAVLIRGIDFKIYVVPADREAQEALVEAETTFWNMVQNNVAPDPVKLSDVGIIWRGRKKEQVFANEGIQTIIDRMNERYAHMKQLEKEHEEDKTKIGVFMGEAVELLDAEGRAKLVMFSAKSITKKFDSAVLKKKYPDIYEECRVDTENSRRMLLCKPKKD